MTGGGITNGIINSSLEATLKDLLYGMGCSVARQLISWAWSVPQRWGLLCHLMLRVGWHRRLKAYCNVWSQGVYSDEYIWVAML